jgi:hypothetical protein
MGSTSAVRMMNSQIPRLRLLVASLALFVSRADANRGAVRRGEREILEPRSGECNHRSRAGSSHSNFFDFPFSLILLISYSEILFPPAL